MLMFLKKFSQARTSWILLLLSSIIFLGCGFFFQYVKELNPCHLCIIQRISFLIIGLGALFPLINPAKDILRNFGLLFWAGGAGLGLYSAIKLVYIQANPVTDLFGSCSLSAEDLINNYPFLEWFPMMFEATGDCSKSSWNFYGIATMEQLTLVIFSVHIIALFAVVISQFKKA
jgi:disulfide bond formation protein DsbB